MSLNYNLIVLVAFIIFKTIRSECMQSYILKCDSFEDLQSYKQADSVSEVIIGSENGTTNITKVDLMHDLPLKNLNKLRTLMVVKAVDGLEARTYAYQCTYYNTTFSSMIFYGNIIKTINNYFFPVVPLKKLSLVNNQIETVSRWAFRDHPIEDLDLSENSMEVVEAESLPIGPVSKTITIRKNKLTHVESGSFSTSLEYLNLDYNKLRYLQDEIFENLINLKELTLSHNSLNVFPNIRHLKKLIVLDISFNAISDFEKETFKDMDELKVIDLSNNRIMNPLILKLIITPNKQPKLIVSLALNRLRSLDINVGLQEQTLVLYGNPFDCNAWDAMKKTLKQHESDCDSKFLSSGTVPYCINFHSGNYIFASLWEQDVENLHRIVKDNEKKAGCILAPKKYTWSRPVRTACVA